MEQSPVKDPRRVPEGSQKDPPHPLAAQLSHFKPQPTQLIRKTIIPPAPPLDVTPFTIISTQEALNSMMKKLEGVQEVKMKIITIKSIISLREIL